MDSPIADTRLSPSIPNLSPNGHFAPSASAGPSRPILQPTSSIDLTKDSDDEAEISAPQTRNPVDGYPFSSPKPSLGPPRYSYSTLPPLQSQQNTDNDDIQITGAKISSPIPRPYLSPALQSPNYHPYRNPSIPSVLAPSSYSSSPFQHHPLQLSGNSIAPGSTAWTSYTPIHPSSPYQIGLNGGSSSHSYGSQSTMDLTVTNSTWTPPPGKEKKVICIGAVNTRAVMYYPSSAAIIGAQPPEGSKERFTTVNYRGAEMLKVKLKVSLCY
jgi:SWI/SNF-related matrix-associated actin-dependent regulator of chromatin subfamily A3